MKNRFFRLLLFVHALCGLWCAPVWSVDYDYKPDTHKIVYSPKVPTAILRVAKKIGPTRFFGTFQRAERKFAVHVYDTSRVKTAKQEYTRSSCLDVFELKADKTWQRIQTLPMQRTAEGKRDELLIQAESMWLDAERKTVPMVSILISEFNITTYEDKSRQFDPIGNQVGIYGALPTVPNPKGFLLLHNYVPYSVITTTSSRVSYPDTNGNLTILYTTSDTAENGYTVYGWVNDNWKQVASDSSENRFEIARVWNGTRFVPLAEWPKTP